MPALYYINRQCNYKYFNFWIDFSMTYTMVSFISNEIQFNFKKKK